MSTTSYSTPKKQPPNPHPYAIKTTSTGLLSRNSSSSSTASATHHYIPPCSPSPSPTQARFGGDTTRHRYSTSESPRPLPPPPSAAALLDDDDTPRRVQRAYSLPQEIKLPEDPKRWTPAEVSIYLTYSLNAAAGGGRRDLPTSVAHDIAAFVKDKKITGRRFLRLNEVDLEEYGINQLWRDTLVDASRALRRNVLRGRIWDYSTEQDDYDDNNLSSNSNYVITNRKRSLSATSESRGRVRDMIDTLERSSSASSSDTDEEGSCTTDGRTNKGAASKREKVFHHHRHRSLEQQQHQQQRQLQLQQQGRLPQRGSVSTLFEISAPGPEREIEDNDSTITAHTRRNANGNEPRLLPFPPAGPRTSNSIANHRYAHIVSPSHTGTSHSLPPSPLDHATNQQTAPYHALNTQPLHHQPFIFPSHSQQNHTPITLDYYELGFKNSFPASPPIRSPNSQRYVVQHNNVQPSSSSTTPGGVSGHSTGGSSKGRRLLPYPPIVGEAELFHPRPRMGVGVGGLASGLEEGLDGDVEEEGDETAYHSALETQTEIADSENGEGSTATFEETPSSGNENENDTETRVGSDATDGVEHPEKEKEEGEEEPSIQSLLLAQSPTRPRTVSGVEAWELELGEAVKRISSSAAEIAGGGSISSIGGTKTRMRPRKRGLMGEIGRRSGKMSEGDDLSKMMTGVLDPELFGTPNPDAACAESDTVDDKGLEASLSSPCSAASASTSSAPSISRQSALDERESAIAILESSLNVRESSIAERDFLVTERESSITSRESTISKHESAITARESALTTHESEIQRRMGDIQQREMEVEKRESEVEKREQEVSERETRVERREEEAKEWYQRKLNEIDEKVLVDVPPPVTASASSSTPVASSSTCTCATAKSKWPPSPMEFARRLCATFLLPVLGEERMPGILLPGNGANSSTSTSSSTTSSPSTTVSVPFWSLNRDFFLNRLLRATAGGGSFIVLVGIGICVIFLRGVVRRVLRVGGFGRR